MKHNAIIKHCPICDGLPSEHVVRAVTTADEPIQILVCQDCGHGWLPTAPAPAKIKALSEDLYRILSPRTNAKLWRIATQLRGACGKDASTILDIGCGNGGFLYNLDDRWVKYGIEFNADRAAMAREYAKATIQEKFVEDCDLSEEFFDCVTMFAVIEHLVAPREVLAKVHKTLKPNGVLMLMTGDRTSWQARRGGPNWTLYRSCDHLHYFSSESLDLLLKEEGFEIERRWWRWSFSYELRFARARRIARGGELLVLGLWELCAPLLRRNIGSRLYLLARKTEG